jgi:hypothetical protein
MDPDMNNYDLEHVCAPHPLMSKESWEKVYRDAWNRYYTDEHVETIMRRAFVNGIHLSKIANAATVFSGSNWIEGVHPLQFGIVRRKVRTQRRYGMPIVNPLVFYPWRAFDMVKTGVRWGWLLLRYRRMRMRIQSDPQARSYIDASLRTVVGANATDEFVQVYADRIPQTHGAPIRQAVAAH